MIRKEFNLPNFLLVGAAKSGTTALYYQLKEHPEIFFSSIKEPCFFSGSFLILPQQGIKDDKKFFVRSFTQYKELFNEADGKKAIGEASADTLYYYENTIPLIKRYLGNPKIIIMLRNPVDRAYSSYLHLVRDERECLTFEDSLAKEEERIRQNWQCMWHHKTRGMYYRQVKAFKEVFEQVGVFLYDDFKKNPKSFISNVYRFLEVEPAFQPANIASRYNVSGIPKFKTLNRFFLMKNFIQRSLRRFGSIALTEDGWVKFRESLRKKLMVKQAMNPETRILLCREFREDILKLQELLNRDLNTWLKC